jgi:hypothetical protein
LGTILFFSPKKVFFPKISGRPQTSGCKQEVEEPRSPRPNGHGLGSFSFFLFWVLPSAQKRGAGVGWVGAQQRAPGETCS